MKHCAILKLMIEDEKTRVLAREYLAAYLDAVPEKYPEMTAVTVDRKRARIEARVEAVATAMSVAVEAMKPEELEKVRTEAMIADSKENPVQIVDITDGPGGKPVGIMMTVWYPEQTTVDEMYSALIPFVKDNIDALGKGSSLTYHACSHDEREASPCVEKELWSL